MKKIARTQYDMPRAARQAAGWASATIGWLGTDFAAATIGEMHRQSLSDWWAARHPDERYPGDIAALKRCYTEQFGVQVTVEHEYPATGQLLTDRAKRISTGPHYVASPAATTTIVAAAQTLTTADHALLTNNAPDDSGHLLLGFPVVAQGPAGHIDDIMAATWWSNDGIRRACNWVATNGPVSVDAFDKARAFAAGGRAQLPPLFPNADFARPRPAAGFRIGDDAIPAEGVYGRDEPPIDDPTGTLTDRLLECTRALLEAGILEATEIAVPCPKGVTPTAGKTLTVTILTIAGQPDADYELGFENSAMAVRRVRRDGQLRWDHPELTTINSDTPADQFPPAQPSLNFAGHKMENR